MDGPNREMKQTQLKPFLRWAGGKQNLLRNLISQLPPGITENGATYYEPFLGAGSLFLALRPKKAVLSDANAHLIQCFRAIKNHPEAMNDNLRVHESRSSRAYYYKIRQEFNETGKRSNVGQASRFLYLNRACFNGIYRVNQLGDFNVPFGDKKNLLLPDLKRLKLLASRLSNVRLSCSSFEYLADEMEEGDFVYLDPPYPPLNGSSYFAHYTKDRFDIADQANVAAFANYVSAQGCKVMVSNADTSDIRRLYSGWSIEPVEVIRFVSCKAVRHRVGELIISNY